jgi:hypothetical protein
VDLAAAGVTLSITPTKFQYGLSSTIWCRSGGDRVDRDTRTAGATTMLNLVNLDAITRQLMLDEIDLDVSNGSLYLSPRLTAGGVTQYEDLLRAAVATGDDSSLSAGLAVPGVLATQEQRNTKSGVVVAKVPITAPKTLAEGEFNRLYARGLCRRALDEGVSEVEVYRAKTVQNPRVESEAMIGARVDPSALLQDLRTHQGVEPALGLPPGPNSGLSVKLP